MKKLKIQSGSLKGKNIPATKTENAKENFTPALLKKTIFSLIENYQLKGYLEKENSTFIDLFAGSGQMGFEAISRGFSKTSLFEIDSKRFSNLAKGIAKNLNGNMNLFKRDVFRFYENGISEENDFAVFFGDPPYSFWESRIEDLENLANKIISIKSKKILLIFQSPLNPDWKNFTVRKYGNHYLLMNSWLNDDLEE